MSRPALRRRAFTLLELMFAIALFATAVVFVIDQRNRSFELTSYSIQLLRAQEIIDEVLAEYRLNPFTEEALPLRRDYKPFEVAISVTQESINIWPEDWRLPEPAYLTPEEEAKKKQRLILRVGVKVLFGTLEDPKPGHYSCEASTLIRHIEKKKPGGT